MSQAARTMSARELDERREELRKVIALIDHWIKPYNGKDIFAVVIPGLQIESWMYAELDLHYRRNVGWSSARFSHDADRGGLSVSLDNIKNKENAESRRYREEQAKDSAKNFIALLIVASILVIIALVKAVT